MAEEGAGGGGGAGAGNGGGEGAGAGQVGAGEGGAQGAAGGAVTLPEWAGAAGLDLETVQKDPILADFAKDPAKLPGVVKGYLEAQKLIGRKGVLLPGKDAKPEEIEAFQLALGRPQDAAGYEFAKPETWPEEIPYTQGVQDWFQGAAFKLGLPKDMAQGLFKEYIAFSLDQHHAWAQQRTEATAAAVKELQKEWGPDFEKNYKAAGGMLVKHGGEELVQRLDLNNDPQLARVLFKLAQATGEDQLHMGGGGGGQTLDDQIREVEGTMKKMAAAGQGGAGNPDYAALMKRRDRLYEQKHPKGKGPGARG